jgi:hypothetical protein
MAPVISADHFANLPDWVTRNPNLAEARAQTEAARHEAKSAAASLMPSIQFELTARRRDIDGAGIPGLDWGAGFSVKQSLYSGGADVARKNQASQRAIETQLAEDKLRRQVERAFAQAISDVGNSAATLAARKEAAQVAAVALEAVREQLNTTSVQSAARLEATQAELASLRAQLESSRAQAAEERVALQAEVAATQTQATELMEQRMAAAAAQAAAARAPSESEALTQQVNEFLAPFSHQVLFPDIFFNLCFSTLFFKM